MSRRTAGVSKLELYQRAQEAIEYLMENHCIVDLSKAEFAYAMGVRHGKAWLLGDGTGNGRLVADVCTLTRDQEDDPYAVSMFSGYRVTYAPSLGGMVLFDPSGEMTMDANLHMLKGDLERQQSAKTVNRRRVSSWNTVGHQALTSGRSDLGRVAFQIEHEIEASGVCSDRLAGEFLRLTLALGREAS